MAEKRRQFTTEFKAQAVELAVESGNIAQTARDLGLSGTTLNKWVIAYRKESARVTDGRALSPSEVAHLHELERDNARLAMENEFLKKAAAFFAKSLIP